MKVTIFFAGALAFVLEGCVAMNTPLVNDKGETFTCRAVGVGVIGSAVVLAQQAKCVSDAHDRGYK